MWSSDPDRILSDDIERGYRTMVLNFYVVFTPCFEQDMTPMNWICNDKDIAIPKVSK